MFVPEVKRQGLLRDIRAQRPDTSVQGVVPREAVEKLVGRLTHAAIVAPEGNAHLQPLYRVRCATYNRVRKSRMVDGSFAFRRVAAWPRKLRVGGKSARACEYQRALDWWQLALEHGVSAPLAPKLVFPCVGSPGCIFVFTDAARESGTGFGGFTFVECDDQPAECWVMGEQWDAHTLRALQADEMSMPAGEAYGAVVLIDAVVSRLRGVTHVVCFTDSDATAKGLTAAGSGAPQLNLLLAWLGDKWSGVQFLGVHQRGVRNVTSDRLSRGQVDLVRRELSSAGIRVQRLLPTAGAREVLEAAKNQPLRLHV